MKKNIVSHSVNCPFCRKNYKIMETQLPYNDQGGWVIQCNTCQGIFLFKLLNPTDYSYIDENNVVIDKWDNDIDDFSEILRRYGNPPFATSYIFRDTIQSFFSYNIQSEPIFRSNYGENLEIASYDKLRNMKQKIDTRISNYFDWWVKKGRNFRFLFIIINFNEPNGDDNSALFYSEFPSNRSSIKELDFLLCDIKNKLNFSDFIIGQNNRRNCKNYLDKMLGLD